MSKRAKGKREKVEKNFESKAFNKSSAKALAASLKGKKWK